MKNLLSIIAICGVLFFASCKKNQCENQYCDNGGTCVNGSCSCPTGYSGLHCDSSNLGLVTFWASSNCSNGPIRVTCGGFTSSISQFFTPDTPTCGTQNCANFRLTAGTYNYTATGNDSTWTGNVTVTQGGCNLQHIGCTTGSLTFYFNAANNVATVSINGSTGQITTAYTSTLPACGAPGCANFTLPIGIYTYTASSSTNTWTGTDTVKANACSLQLLQ